MSRRSCTDVELLAKYAEHVHLNVDRVMKREVSVEFDVSGLLLGALTPLHLFIVNSN